VSSVEGAGDTTDRGVLTTHLRSDGVIAPNFTSMAGLLNPDGWPPAHGRQGSIPLRVGMVTDVVKDAFAATGLTADDLNWFVPHQANRRIIDMSASKARHSC